MTSGEYLDMPDGMYPVHLFHQNFRTLGLWFPAKDAWVLEALCRRVSCDDALEIGSFAGASATILARHFRRVTCVDTWQGSGPDDPVTELYAKHDVFRQFLENTREISEQLVWHVRKTEPDSLPGFLLDRGVKYDLIFIDGAHDTESVLKDIRIAEDWISPGGIICGHDYSFSLSVTEAVNKVKFDQACGTVWWKEY